MANFVQSAVLRSTLLMAYRAYARAQFWRAGPRVFINSIPKAGTHLVTSQLNDVPQLQNSRLWIRRRLVNAAAMQDERIVEFQFDRAAFQKHLDTVRYGQFFTGHLQFSPELLNLLQDNAISTLFVKRHPLDIVVSMFHYLKGLRRHPIHAVFMGLKDDEARIDLLIRGDESLQMVSMASRLRAFQGWQESSNVLTVRFEDLVGSRGGGDDTVRERTKLEILDFLGLPTKGISSGEVSTRSATFRKGKINAWSELLTPDRLVRLTDDDHNAIREFGYDI